MTRRPRKANVPRKPMRKRRRTVARAKPRPRAPLDDFIAAGMSALDLKIDEAWLPAVRSDLQVTLRHGALVTAFALPDDAEPAPVFKA